MAENVGGSDLFGSGGHAWRWGKAPVGAKEFTAVGMTGAGRITLTVGSQPCVIEGGDGSRQKGGPAVLKASGASKAAADAALDALEAPIEALRRSGDDKTWEDDCGRTGSNLVILDYARVGGRWYAKSTVGGDTTWHVWQYYQCLLAELAAAGA